MKVNIMGHDVDFDAAINLMDDDLREILHSSLECEDELSNELKFQLFVDAYCELHFKKFNEEFEVN